MKRDHKPKYDGLFPVFTFFEWHQCCKCGNDFRLERGWVFQAGPYHGGRGVWKYLCRECAPTEEDAQREREASTFDFAGAIDRVPKITLAAYADLMREKGDE